MLFDEDETYPPDIVMDITDRRKFPAAMYVMGDSTQPKMIEPIKVDIKERLSHQEY